VRDERLLAAIEAVPRDAFVPAERAIDAYLDAPIPIPHGQVTTQPSLVGAMVEALALTGTERVLEIGTGYGWQTALLARLSQEVWSVERYAGLAREAGAALERSGLANAHVEVGDGSAGLPEHAPYDAVIVAAAFPEVPPPLTEQLRPGGRLVQPMGEGGAEQVVLFERTERGLARRRQVIGAHFVRLYGRYGFPP
jgi:protein-L-isoaspartate(D-aspartate) O-methyltransferase